ncbi:MAG: hypothetical protein R2712_25535, partial [Vicinamibacterales bacterium]
MNAPASAAHPTDDDLVLHYYAEDEGADRVRVASHLASCADCRSSFEQLGEVLALVSQHADEPAPEGFERVMWARVGPAVEAGAAGGWRRWFPVPRLALAGGVLALVLAAFVAGRWSTPPVTDPAAV